MFSKCTQPGQIYQTNERVVHGAVVNFDEVFRGRAISRKARPETSWARTDLSVLPGDVGDLSVVGRAPGIFPWTVFVVAAGPVVLVAQECVIFFGKLIW